MALEGTERHALRGSLPPAPQDPHPRRGRVASPRQRASERPEKVRRGRVGPLQRCAALGRPLAALVEGLSWAPRTHTRTNASRAAKRINGHENHGHAWSTPSPAAPVTGRLCPPGVQLHRGDPASPRAESLCGAEPQPTCLSQQTGQAARPRTAWPLELFSRQGTSPGCGQGSPACCRDASLSARL